MTQEPNADDPQDTPETTAANEAPSRNRRKFLRYGLFGIGAAAILGGGMFAARWYNVSAEVTDTGLSVQEAHERATRGDILLIDIRRPDEWNWTGIGEGARPLDMRRADFIPALMRMTAGLTDLPVALICARGVRSRHMADALAEAGFTNVLDVPEGMMGSGAGPGWLKAGLPVVRP